MQRGKILGLTFHLPCPDWLLVQILGPALLVLGYHRHCHQTPHQGEPCDSPLICHPPWTPDQRLSDPLQCNAVKNAEHVNLLQALA